MFPRLFAIVGLTIPTLLLHSALAAEPAPPASHWIPPNALVAIELSRPDVFLDRALDPKVIAAMTSSPIYQSQASKPGFQQFQQGIAFLEARLGVDWKTGVRKLIGGGVTLAATPDQSVYLIADCEDEHMLAQLQEILLGFARAEANRQGEPDRVASREYRGVTGWKFGKEGVHAIIGKRLVAANRPEALKAVIDLRAEPDRLSLASSPGYQAAKRAGGDEAAALAFVNLEMLNQHPPVKQALTESHNPLAALLVAGMLEAAGHSTWLSVGLSLEGNTLALKAAVDGKIAGPAGKVPFASASQAGGGALPHLCVPRLIASLSLYRDLHAFYSAKDELFPERTSGLVFFENMMGIFFGGRDLTEEVLGETKPYIRLVVAEQEYDPQVGQPRVQLPSFAAVFQLQHPEKFGLVAEEAWQKALGLINFTRGQQALPGLIIDRPVHGDTKFTAAYFAPADLKDKTNVDTRFNFRPALALLDDYLVLSSTERLARDLIDALKKEVEGPVLALSETNSLAVIEGPQLASILRANRTNLVRQNMIKEGNTQEQAEAEIDTLLSVAKYLGKAVLNVADHDGRPQANLQITLDLP